MALPDFTETQWRNSGLPARLGLGFAAIDARVFVFFIIWLVHMRTWTLVMAVVAVILAAILEYLGFGMGVAFKRVRAAIAGKNRVVHKSSLRRRRMINE